MLVAAMVIAVLVKRIPEALAEVEFAKRGEQSPASAARAQRLTDAGIDPAAGGAFRQYAGNLWRDTWLDLDEQRRARRAAREPYDPTGPSWWERLRARLDEATDRFGDRWRHPDDDPDPPGDGRAWDHDERTFDGEWTDTEPDSGGSEPDRGKSGPDPDPRDPGGPEGGATPTPDEEPGWSGDAGTPANDDPTTPSPGSAATDDPREPVRGVITRDPPEHETANPTEGDPMSALVRAGAVTGVVSGAAEARAIQRALEAANTAYVTELNRIRARINSLGEQTLSTVQMAQRSTVVSRLVQAAEAAAAAQAAARTCGAEVGPLMGQVARAFERLNS